MGIYDTSYPPEVLMLPGSHDLQLVGTPVGLTLEVNFTWDSDGKAAMIDFDDGSTETTASESANHTYATNGVYDVRVISGRASDSATLDLSAADEPETETEPTTFTAIPVDEIPSE